jgi:hypothetical protein
VVKVGRKKERRKMGMKESGGGCGRKEKKRNEKERKREP